MTVHRTCLFIDPETLPHPPLTLREYLRYLTVLQGTYLCPVVLSEGLCVPFWHCCSRLHGVYRSYTCHCTSITVSVTATVSDPVTVTVTVPVAATDTVSNSDSGSVTVSIAVTVTVTVSATDTVSDTVTVSDPVTVTVTVTSTRLGCAMFWLALHCLSTIASDSPVLLSASSTVSRKSVTDIVVTA
ncbi:hypothetical protein ADUPG1_001532, partial [Aduncisulcus paluster]